MNRTEAPDPLTPDAALARLAQYGERTSTWSTATYADGTERALADIARALAGEVTRLRAERSELNEMIRTPQDTSRGTYLLDRIRSERGQWTPGRVKRLYKRIWPAQYVLRATIRADLARLHRDGYLTLHDTAGRRFYTLKEGS
ncbi:hypothetical protein [Streptomyces sp. CA-253872]|uniref:hypothetical protein n=1 Tax=Streptomyces sp. CA-253872 TaxID=3240067 RepID=UPI003D8ABDF1